MAYRKRASSRASSRRSSTRSRARSTSYKSRRPAARAKRAVRGRTRAPSEVRIVIVQDTGGAGVNSVAAMANGGSATKPTAPAKKAKF